MLVLGRKVNESIVVGDDVVITVLDVKGDQVRIGIDAPRSVAVHRREVYEDIKRSNHEAAATQTDTGSLPLPPPERKAPRD